MNYVVVCSGQDDDDDDGCEEESYDDDDTLYLADCNRNAAFPKLLLLPFLKPQRKR